VAKNIRPRSSRGSNSRTSDSESLHRDQGIKPDRLGRPGGRLLSRLLVCTGSSSVDFFQAK
jgi:hypothetical protein